MGARSYIRYLLLILLSILLTACASYRYVEEVAIGRIYFDQGNFRKAFRQLLPPAAGGNPKAQYAVGYMYYYGYGVAQDTDAGLFWMQRAADCHFVPAMRALDVIYTQHPPEEKHVPVSLKDEINPKATVLKTIGCSNPKPLPDVCKLQKKIIRAEGYGVQLFGAYELEEVKQFQTRVALPKATVIWHTENGSKDWYVLMYGHYATIAEAKSALNSLPQSMKEMHPWVRGLKGLG